MLNDAQRFWDAIVGKVRRTAQDEAKNALRLERYEVTTAANGTKMGVTLPMGTKEIFLPYSNEVASAGVGTPVLVGWWGSMSNAKVYYFADGYKGVSGHGGNPLDSYPIGSFYISANSTSPAELFGGEWERITGRFLLAATDGGSSGASQAAGNTGGEDTHKLTTNEIPAHTHGSKSLTGYIHSRRYGGSSQTDIIGINGTSGIVSKSTVTWSGTHAQLASGGASINNPTLDRLNVDATHEHTSVGGGQAHNNMPPYLAVYIWKRVA